MVRVRRKVEGEGEEGGWEERSRRVNILIDVAFSIAMTGAEAELSTAPSVENCLCVYVVDGGIDANRLVLVVWV